MARGITEKDVFAACDALVLAGERPTIERVRQKIGRGSPNTVSPMLDAWFRGLGRRLQDPGAFAPPPDIPESVLQAAQHFWEVAQAASRAELEQQVSERLIPMQAEVDRAVQSEARALAERETAIGYNRDLRRELSDAGEELKAERVARAAASTREQAGLDQIAALNGRLAALEAHLRETDERARRDILAAQERAAGAERRAAMEIENERVSRSRAEKRSEGLEKRLEGLQATSASQVEELVKTRTSLDHERASTKRLQAAIEAASLERQAVEAALIEARLAIGRAEAEAKVTQAAMDQLLPLLSEGKPKKAAPRQRQTAKGG